MDQGFAQLQLEVQTKVRLEVDSASPPATPSFPGPLRLEPPWALSTPIQLSSSKIQSNLPQAHYWSQTIDTWLQKNAHLLVYRSCRQSLVNSLNNEVTLPKLNQPVVVPATFGPPVCSEPGNFDSRFQCGNLRLAFRGGRQREFNLVLDQDTNSQGYSQWFYFSLPEAAEEQYFCLSIINLRKGGLWQKGMRPVFCTEASGWRVLDCNLQFYRNGLLTSRMDPLHTLTFPVKAKGRVLVASSLPYSYTRLQRALQGFGLQYIGNTLGGRKVPLLRFGKEGPVILVVARQHPGEASASHLAESILQQLREKGPKVSQLLGRAQVAVIPMVNVDGVIAGNHRCDLSGLDLNRLWTKPCQHYHPQIAKAKLWLAKAKPRLFIDLHGHSKQLNAFAYSCASPLLKRMVWLIAEKQPKFRWNQSTFGLLPSKYSTARAIASRQFGCQALTIETSLFGTDEGGNRPWGKKDFDALAQSVLDSIDQVLFSHDFQRIDRLIEQKENELAKEGSSDSEAQLRVNQRLKSDLQARQDRTKRVERAFRTKRIVASQFASKRTALVRNEEEESSENQVRPRRCTQTSQRSEEEPRSQIRDRALSDLNKSRALIFKEQASPERDKIARPKFGELLQKAKAARYKGLVQGIVRLKSRKKISNELLESAVQRERRRVRMREQTQRKLVFLADAAVYKLLK